MTEGTILTVTKINTARKIAYLHMLFLKQKTDKPQVFLNFMLEALKVDVKCAQHYIGTLYPNRRFSLEDLRSSLPELFFDVPVHMASNLDYKFTVAAVAAHILKTSKYHDMFKKSEITVTEPFEENIKNENAEALEQTGQRAPDYHILFATKVHKFMDLKATLKYINRGHIVIIGNTKDYEDAVAFILKAQAKLYKKSCSILSDYIGSILTDKNKTWHERNVDVQNFLVQNFKEMIHINPSIIIKEEFISDKGFNMKKYDHFINSKSFITKEATENTITSIIDSDKIAKATYKYQYGINTNIDKNLTQATFDTIDYLLK